MQQTVKRRALVLSGGSIKGAFQAGALREVFDSGFVPDSIYGTSVGALNASYLAHLAGEAKTLGNEPDWPEFGRTLARFWTKNVTGPETIAHERSFAGNIWNILREHFEGLYDTHPLASLVRNTLDRRYLRTSPVAVKVSAVNLATGELVVADPSFPDYEEYVIASTAIPVLMPARMLPLDDPAAQPHVDGGLRDVAMLNKAIDEGADEIVVILCQPEQVVRRDFNPGNLIQFMSRLMDIIVNELVNNDIHWLHEYNRLAVQHDGGLIPGGCHKGKRYVEVKVIRPVREPRINLDDFGPADIRRVMGQGRRAARKVLDGAVNG